MPDSPVRVKSDLELLREKNIKIRDDFFFSLIKDDPDFIDVKELMSNLNKRATKKPRVQRSSGSGHDPSFVGCKVPIPLERRRSARLQQKQPDPVDLEAIEPTRKRNRSEDDDYTDLEEIIYEPKIPKAGPSSRRTVHLVIPPENIVEDMLKEIAKRSSLKIHSEAGTCCHQCRQKTMDLKTNCRNPSCIGLRGQFCGICLRNRYGENASEALKDPNWHCPVCRGICNCSFCRTKAGKRPTGVLAPMAQLAGHKSVKDFLDSLNGRGDYAHEDNLPPEEEELNDLLGFSNDGNVANMSDGQLYEFKAALNLEMMKIICMEKENKLNIFKAVYDESHNFLGFYKDSDSGLLENKVECDMESSFSMEMKMECESFDEDVETLSIPENAFIKSEIDIEEPTISGAYLDNKIEDDFNSYAHPIKTEELPPTLYPVTFEPVTENGAGSGYLHLKVENNFDPCDRPIKTEEMPPILHPVTFVSVTENVNPQLKVEIKDEPVDNGNSSSMPDPLAITPKDIKNLTSPQNVFLSVEGILERENRNRPDLMRTYSIDEFEKFYERKIIEYGYACAVREIGRRLLEHSLSTMNHPN